MFCPQCGQKSLTVLTAKELRCDCGFHYFHNVAASVMAALCWQDELLLAVRARNPQQGLLQLPGGFVDPGENLEQALRRELIEELNFDIGALSAQYFASFANTYLYDGITYQTCDAFFMIDLADKPVLQAGDDVAACEWFKWHDVDLDKIAFCSVKAAIAQLKSQKMASFSQ